MPDSFLLVPYAFVKAPSMKMMTVNVVALARAVVLRPSLSTEKVPQRAQTSDQAFRMMLTSSCTFVLVMPASVRSGPR